MLFLALVAGFVRSLGSIGQKSSTNTLSSATRMKITIAVVLYFFSETGNALKRLPKRLLRWNTALITLALLGCAQPRDQATVIDFWAMGREGEIVQQLIPEFERRHPGLRVRVQQIPWSAAHEKLLTAFAGDAMPDIFQLGSTWIPEFVALGALIDLGQGLADSRLIDNQDFFSGIMNANIIDDAIYGVPWYVDTRVLFYRKDLLERAGFTQAPKNWSQWCEAMRRLKELQGEGSYALLLPLNDWTPLAIFALQMNAEILSGGNRFGNFRNPRFAEAFGFYLDLFRQGYALAVGAMQLANVYQEFARGHIAMYISGPWNIGEFRSRLPTSMQHLWMTAPLPGPDHEYPGTSLAGGASLVISRSSQHQNESWKLIEYLTAPDQQTRFHNLTGDLPANKRSWEDDAIMENPHVKAFWKQLRKVDPPPKIPEWERIATKMTQYSEAVVRARSTPPEALAELNAEVDRILEKRRWMLGRKD